VGRIPARACTALGLCLALAAGGCGHAVHPANTPWREALSSPACTGQQAATPLGAQGSAPAPIWAVQLPWAPAAPSLALQYDSSDRAAPVAGAYDSTAAVTPGAAWQTYTWKLTDVAWAGGENFGADLRVAATPGVAVHEVVLGLEPPGSGGPVASITFPSTADGLRQVGAGGNQGDSAYHVAEVGGEGAEVLDSNPAAGAGAPSYIYLRVARASPLFTEHPATVYATVTYRALQPGQPWSQATFAALAAKGVGAAEINLEWSALEPQPGQFDFTLLDADLANAAAAGVKLIPIFWYSVWSGNPAPWITDYDRGSTGAPSQVPTWWSAANRSAYFTYVRDTVAHVRGSPAFGGAFLNFGWLDYMWGPGPGGSGVNGYAPEDVARFRAWLPGEYGSLAAFNRQNGTSYTAWDQVPAAGPGQPLFAVYQHFRDWSVQETYARLSAIYRGLTAAPLYYYFGGGPGGFGTAFNLPDTFFQVAKRYGGTVVLDDANVTGLALMFSSLARTYGVPLLEEWTPAQEGLAAESAEFLGHYGLERPEAAGLDFFIYQGGTEYDVGFPAYTAAIPLLAQFRGAYPQPPVAVYVSYGAVYQDPGALAGIASLLEGMWRRDPTAFTVVTSAEVAAGLVRLSSFRAVLPLNGAGDAAIAAYARAGGSVVHGLGQFAPHAVPYAVLAPDSDQVEVVPTVDASSRTAWLAVAGVDPTATYRGLLTFRLAGLGLPPGRYHLVDLRTGRAVPAAADQDCLSLPVDLAPGTLRIWRLEPGAGPGLPAAQAADLGGGGAPARGGAARGAA
jgi:hypothetical protein